MTCFSSTPVILKNLLAANNSTAIN
jgi:hypothetical protein